MTRSKMYKLDKRDIASPELCERVYNDLMENGPSVFDDVCGRVAYHNDFAIAAAIGLLRTEDRVIQERPSDFIKSDERENLFEWFRLTRYSAV